jgi:hypothetical protein
MSEDRIVTTNTTTVFSPEVSVLIDKLNSMGLRFVVELLHALDDGAYLDAAGIAETDKDAVEQLRQYILSECLPHERVTAKLKSNSSLGAPGW